MQINLAENELTAASGESHRAALSNGPTKISKFCRLRKLRLKKQNKTETKKLAKGYQQMWDVREAWIGVRVLDARPLWMKSLTVTTVK